MIGLAGVLLESCWSLRVLRKPRSQLAEPVGEAENAERAALIAY